MAPLQINAGEHSGAFAANIQAAQAFQLVPQQQNYMLMEIARSLDLIAERLGVLVNRPPA